MHRVHADRNVLRLACYNLEIPKYPYKVTHMDDYASCYTRCKWRLHSAVCALLMANIQALCNLLLAARSRFIFLSPFIDDATRSFKFSGLVIQSCKKVQVFASWKLKKNQLFLLQLS